MIKKLFNFDFVWEKYVEMGHIILEIVVKQFQWLIEGKLRQLPYNFPRQLHLRTPDQNLLVKWSNTQRQVMAISIQFLLNWQYPQQLVLGVPCWFSFSNSVLNLLSQHCHLGIHIGFNFIYTLRVGGFQNQGFFILQLFLEGGKWVIAGNDLLDEVMLCCLNKVEGLPVHKIDYQNT